MAGDGMPLWRAAKIPLYLEQQHFIQLLYMRWTKPLFASALALCCTSAFSQTADEIIDKNVSATGGKEAWNKINSIREEAVLNANGTEIKMTLIVVRDKGARQNISVAGMNGYVITTPTNGWGYLPWAGHMKPEAFTAEDVKEGQDDLDIAGPLVDYKAKGHTAEYIGMDEFEGTDCYKVKLTEKSGKVVTYFIDPSNYFIIHSETISKANGKETTAKTDYSNYQKLPEGIWLPMTLISFSQLKFKKIEINPAVDEKIFVPGNNL
jgi:hypothetical protein